LFEVVKLFLSVVIYKQKTKRATSSGMARLNLFYRQSLMQQIKAATKNF
jgi:hypothetical protein